MGAEEKYTFIAVLLHWITALFIASAFVLGIYMTGLLLSPLKLRLYSYHKWAGVFIFAIALLRISWRAFNPPPKLPAHMADWEKNAAKAAHYALYALITVVPLSGWIMSSAHGFQTVFLGVLPLPDIIGKDKELAGQLESLHFILNKLLLLTIIAHAVAALKHHFIDRDDVLIRMLRWR